MDGRLAVVVVTTCPVVLAVAIHLEDAHRVAFRPEHVTLLEVDVPQLPANKHFFYFYFLVERNNVQSVTLLVPHAQNGSTRRMAPLCEEGSRDPKRACCCANGQECR